jgi:hypothetical protein
MRPTITSPCWTRVLCCAVTCPPFDRRAVAHIASDATREATAQYASGLAVCFTDDFVGFMPASFLRGMRR